MLTQAKPLLLGLSLALFMGAPVLVAGTPGVRDNGDFFSDAAKKEANKKIAEIDQQYKKELVIESFAEIPEEIKKGVDLTDKAAMNRMFEQWTVKEAKQQRVNGIYILLSRDPSHLQIVVGNDTQKHAFTLKDRDNLASLMLGKLRAKQNDEALLEGVKYVASTMSLHASQNKVTGLSTANPAAASRTQASEPAFQWGWILTIVLGLGAVWVVFGILRSFMGRGAAGAPGMMPGMGGGGGMFGSLLGGMFGAAAGMWLYDQFSGGHSNAWGGDQQNRDLGGTGFSGQDTDYSGTGGDFGGDYGGDAGGDTSGGGDF